MKEIQLTRGYVALVDDEDFDLLNQYKWQVVISLHTVYASRRYKEDGKTKYIRMHREILNITDLKIDIDHLDQDGLNNQKANLRPCTHRQNMRNRKSLGGSSVYKGVCWNTQCGKWQANIKVNGKDLYLGRYDDECKAGEAYNIAAKKYFGEFAFINNIQNPQSLQHIVPKPVSKNSRRSGSTKYKGVHVVKPGRWHTSISVGGKSKYIGSFTDEKEAAIAYNKAAIEYFGPNAFQNKID